MERQVRKIVKIDEEKCNGCGLCIPSCAEGAIQIIDGKARLIDDRFCDGLGNCLGECPQGAISIIEREAEAFDEKAVEEHLRRKDSAAAAAACAGSCPGSTEKSVNKTEATAKPAGENFDQAAVPEPELSHWPIQLHLVSPQARFLQGRDLLLCADCVPFAFADFHRQMLKGKSLIICCPKLDDVQAYLSKLTAIFEKNEIKSITLAHMEVPCCYGLVRLARAALEKSGKEIPVREVTITVGGEIEA